VILERRRVFALENRAISLVPPITRQSIEDRAAGPLPVPVLANAWREFVADGLVVRRDDDERLVRAPPPPFFGRRMNGSATITNASDDRSV
jgi:hypothetical protein